MQQSLFSFVALALATTAAAMPGTALHAVKAARSAAASAPKDLSARQGTIDWVGGTCGGSTGFVCHTGYCCSQYGYCGTGSEYCGGNPNPGIPVNAGVVVGDAAGDAGNVVDVIDDVAADAGNTGKPGNPGGDIQCNRRDFSGDGSTGAGWPSESQWASFENLWNANMWILESSCTQFGGQANNSPQEIAYIKSAIQSISQQSGVDARFILVTMVQESKGCVRVHTTANAHPNPGLMQDHSGSFTCYQVNSCPENQIVGMIRSGTMGTSSGDGLMQILSGLNTSGAQKIYQAARIYNSGSIASDGNLSNGNGATAAYASDIANRLTGCTF